MVTPHSTGSERFFAVDFPAEDERWLAFNPRGNRLAVSWKNADHVRVFDPRSGDEVTRCTGFQSISSIVFLSAEVLLVAAFGGCYRCNLRRGERELLSREGWQTGMSVSPDGRVLAIGVRGGLLLYDLVKGKVRNQFVTAFHPDYVGDRAAFSTGGHYVAGALSARSRNMGIVVIWDAQTGRRQRVFDALAYALAFRADTLTLAVAADSGYVELYEPDQGEEPARKFFFDYALPNVMEFQNRGRTLALLMHDGAFIELVPNTGRNKRRISPPVDDKLGSAVTSADWSLFAGATDNGVVVWHFDAAAKSNSRPRQKSAAR